MESGSQILASLRELAQQEQPLILLNTYRGVPVVTTARIINVSSGYVAVSVHEFQAVCMSIEGNTHIQSDYLSQAYQAEAVAVDVLKKQAILTDFTPVEEGVGKRVNVRVRPDDPMDVEITGDDFTINGKVADVSTSGVGIYTLAAYVFGEMPVEPGAAVSVTIRLPKTQHALQLPGQVSNLVYQEGNIIQRIGVRIDAQAELVAELQDYVSVREEEILHELELIYDTLRRDSEKRR